MIFDYNFAAQKNKFEDKFSWMKWTVIADEKGKFTWVISKRKHIKDLVQIDQTHEHAAWVSEIYENLSANAIIDRATSCKVDPSFEEYIDIDVLMFSLVHAFTQNGYELDCVSVLS